LTERNPVVVVLLSLVTFSLYGFYWLYVTTEELADVTGDPRLDPTVDLILALVTFGVWGLYAAWRNAEIAHRALVARGVAHQDRSTMVAGFGIATFFFGLAWLVSIALLQEDYNALARAGATAALPAADDAPLPVTY
jgi:hypothetical protein